MFALVDVFLSEVLVSGWLFYGFDGTCDGTCTLSQWLGLKGTDQKKYHYYYHYRFISTVYMDVYDELYFIRFKFYTSLVKKMLYGSEQRGFSTILLLGRELEDFFRFPDLFWKNSTSWCLAAIQSNQYRLHMCNLQFT